MKEFTFSRSAIAALSVAVCAGLLGIPKAAEAADWVAPRERMCDYGRYNGFYVGGNAGYVEHMTQRTDSDALLGEAASLNADVGSISGGVEGGYNWQFHCTVFGVEADWQWAGANATGQLLPNTPAVASFSANMEWFSTVRARAGILIDQTLLYGTAGVAFTEIKDTWTVGPPVLVPTFTSTFTNTRVGLAAGAGVEYAWSESISLKAEALYLAFTDTSNTFAVPPALALNPVNLATIRGADSAIVARAGINIKLGPWDTASGLPTK
jgi:outer membrane immunogenic protein